MRKHMLDRLDTLKVAFSERNLRGVAVMQSENRMYYSGFTGSNGILLVTTDQNYLVTDGRYIEQASREAEGFEIVPTTKKQAKDVQARFSELVEEKCPGEKIGFEGNVITFSTYETYFKNASKVEFHPVDELITSPRLCKSPGELLEIRQAIEIAEIAFEKIEHLFAPGNSERQVSAEMDLRMRLEGAQKPSFDTIIGSGENGALPHAKITDRVFREGDAVVCDWGALTDSGYNSDMTRTIFIGKPNEELLNVYRIVLEAQLKALAEVRPGIQACALDAVARTHIEEAGYGQYFIHGLGHGVGLAIHEGPTINESKQEILRPGMILTVEPGIYLPGKGGVRIEDMVMVTESGGEVLTSLEKIRY